MNYNVQVTDLATGDWWWVCKGGARYRDRSLALAFTEAEVLQLKERMNSMGCKVEWFEV